MNQDLKTILVIDDSALERDLLVAVLQSNGVLNPFLHAGDGDEAIEVLGRHFNKICLILLDWQMPNMSGIDFMKTVVRVDAVKNIPIVMVSASGNKEDVDEAYAVNPQLAGYVIKPYTPEQILQVIEPFVTLSQKNATP